MEKSRLIKDCGNYQRNNFEDFFCVVAHRIESSMIEAGASAGEDYTMLDLFKLAQPFVLHRFEKAELS